MSKSVLANRYLNAYVNCFEHSDKLGALKDLKGVLESLKSDPKVLTLISTPSVSFDDKLNFINSTKIGDEEPNQVYSSEIINDKVYFGITNFTDINLVKIYNSNNELDSTIEVGLFPGDFAYWEEQ